MNVTEANAFNVLLRALTGQPALTGGPYMPDEVLHAAEHLRQRAHTALAAGPTADDVARWVATALTADHSYCLPGPRTPTDDPTTVWPEHDADAYRDDQDDELTVARAL